MTSHLDVLLLVGQGSVLRVDALPDVPAHSLVPLQGQLVHVVVETLQLLQLPPFHLEGHGGHRREKEARRRSE